MIKHTAKTVFSAKKYKKKREKASSREGGNFESGNTENTMEFIKYLQQQRPGKR